MQVNKNGSLVSLIRGDSGAISLGEITVNGVAVEATGILSIKKKASDTEYVLQVEMDANNNFVFEPADTQELEPGAYVYDVQITIDGAVYTPVIGRFNIIADITRPESTEEEEESNG